MWGALFRKVLIANRGEIALRIIRGCRELNILTVAVYSEADAESLPVKMADEAVCIGPPPSSKSYLNIPAIISAAEVTGAEAIHPGYGFLAENHNFAEACGSSNITFIGPPAHVIERLGNKAAAKEDLRKTGIPVIPGSEGVLRDKSEALKMAGAMGYPVILKASAGGGGRGMRVAQNQHELENLVSVAQSEAKAAFGSSAIYVEKYIQEPRHIEFQIVADSHGNVLHLGERDCSVQRRHQKLIEESPSKALDAQKREAMAQSAIAVAEAVGYQSAGTIEFLLDKEGNYYFMEANTRIQVEHPVTEMVTGADLIKEQIRVAAGETLDLDGLESHGHAIEFRINAEDPDADFLPKPGTIDFFNGPGGPGVRVDTHVYSGYTVPPFYDSLIAKLVVWGQTREEALDRARRALGEFTVVGVETTVSFHKRVVENAFFRRGEVYTNFVARRILNE